MKLIRFSAVLCFSAFFFLSAQDAAAQVEIGIKVSPSIASTRTIAQSKYNLKSDGASGGFGFGVIADYFFGVNYAFSTGLLYNIKGGDVAYNYSESIDGTTTVKSAEDALSLHYLEVPLSLKLFTNEVAPDVRVYFQAGGSLNAMLAGRVNGDKVDSYGDKYTKRFNLFEIDGLLGAGAEWQLGQSTKLFGGLSYHHGLTDIDSFYEEELGDSKIELKNSTFAIDFGIKF